MASHYRVTEPLHEFMKRWTHREYLLRLAWLDEQWNRPSRSDNYQMQTAAEVRRVLSKKPNTIKLGHFKLSFGSPRRKSGVTKEQATKFSKARWFGFLGIGRKKSGRGN